MATTKIIIVDKQPLFRVGVKQAFIDIADFKIVEASPDDNLTMIIETDLPDVILLDLVMPVVDGFTVLQSVKSDPKFKNIPVIVTSNLGQDEDVKKAMKLGAKDYIIKSDTALSGIIEKIKADL